VPTHSVVYASLGLLEQRARGQRSFDTPGQDDSFRERFLTNIADQFRSQRQVAERALEQTSDQDFFDQLGPESNSIATLVKHLAGNHRSRWTDFLTTDGEKPDRHRDTEFEVEGASRQTLMAAWDSGWTTLLDTVDGLTPNDLDTVVEVRGQPHKVEVALTRSLVHSAGHVGQLVLLAKHLRGLDWRTLSIPRGGTEAFNRQMRQKLGTKS
jgi:hypothetical protein